MQNFPAVANRRHLKWVDNAQIVCIWENISFLKDQ